MALVHSEIQYKEIAYEDGKFIDKGWRHSDLCPGNCDPDGIDNKEYRQFLHDNLDEWLNKSNGTGFFYVGTEEDMREASLFKE